MLGIFIGRRKEKIRRADGTCMEVFPTYIPMNGDLHSLHACNSFAEADDDVVFLLPRRFWFVQLHPAPRLKAAIVEFLRRYHAKQDMSFDCYSFANLVCAVAQQNDKTRRNEFWRLHPNRWRQRMGDVVFLVSIKSDGVHFHHAAIYIGKGLFISVYGAGGDLEIATLRDMKRDYGAEQAMLATPRIQAAT